MLIPTFMLDCTANTSASIRENDDQYGSAALHMVTERKRDSVREHRDCRLDIIAGLTGFETVTHI